MDADLALRIVTLVIGLVGLVTSLVIAKQQRHAARELERLKAELTTSAEVRRRVAVEKVAVLIGLHKHLYSDEPMFAGDPLKLHTTDEAKTWNYVLHDHKRRAMPFLATGDYGELKRLCEDTCQLVRADPGDYPGRNVLRTAITDLIRKQFEVAGTP